MYLFTYLFIYLQNLYQIIIRENSTLEWVQANF